MVLRLHAYPRNAHFPIAAIGIGSAAQPRLGLVGQPKRGQHHSREAYAEAPQRLSGVTAWANALANSSNLPFIVFPSVVVLDYGLCGEILIPLGMMEPLTTSVLLSGVPSIGSFSGLA
jgi:hypothetical protein